MTNELNEFLLKKSLAATKAVEDSSKKLQEDLESYEKQVLEFQTKLRELDQEIANKQLEEKRRSEDWNRQFTNFIAASEKEAQEKLAAMKKEAALSTLSEFNMTAVSEDRLDYLEQIRQSFNEEVAKEIKEARAKLETSLKAEYSTRKDDTIQNFLLENSRLKTELESTKQLLESAKEERNRAFEELKEERKASVERTRGAAPTFNLNDVKK